MKTLRAVGKCVVAMFVAASMVACDDNGEPTDDIVFNLSKYSVDYDADGAWVDAYNVDVTQVELGGFEFSHTGIATEWDGMVYSSYYGFVPSRSSDNADHSGDDWVQYQWGSITGGGVSGKGSPFMLGSWNVMEDLSMVAAPYLSITYGGQMFDPEEVYVTNSAYGYYAMKNGTAFNKQFGADDWMNLHIIGVRNGVETGKVDVALAANGKLLDSWKRVDLDALGDAVNMIYFQFSSSDSGQWGMNNPAYFCLDRLKIELTDNTK
ncbi:MAG: DUF4465 domain-containing protein [Muribaculaceae bacterium]|nr:DUF4465 domain-containing protein [Muribaculaceae bacterium]